MSDERIERVRVPLTGLASGSWAPEEQRPEARIALNLLDSLQRDLAIRQSDARIAEARVASLERELTEWKDQATKNLASRDEWSIRAHDAERELTELREALREAWPLIGWRTPKERATVARIRDLLSHHDEVTG